MTVEVILLERIERLGNLGDVVQVAPGYARNFLLPTGKALRANAENKKTFEAEKKKYESANEAKKVEAEKLAKKIDGVTVKLIRAASETGQLYGSVSGRDIAEALSAKDHIVERSAVLIGKAIKDIGEHEVKMRFHADVLATVTVQVVKNAEDVIVAAPSVEERKLSKAETIAQLKAEKKEATEKAKLARAAMQAEEKTSKSDGEDEKSAKKPAAKKDAAKKPAAKKPVAKKAKK